MPDTDDGIEEARIGTITVRIDRYICVGFGDCIETSPTPFQFDDEGIATFRPGCGTMDESAVIEACRTCPVDALTVFDTEGTQIAP